MIRDSKKKNFIIKNVKLSQLKSKKKFNTIIYADVLEHIKYDLKEIQLAVKYLKKRN